MVLLSLYLSMRARTTDLRRGSSDPTSGRGGMSRGRAPVSGESTSRAVGAARPPRACVEMAASTNARLSPAHRRDGATSVGLDAQAIARPVSPPAPRGREISEQRDDDVRKCAAQWIRRHQMRGGRHEPRKGLASLCQVIVGEVSRFMVLGSS